MVMRARRVVGVVEKARRRRVGVRGVVRRGLVVVRRRKDMLRGGRVVCAGGEEGGWVGGCEGGRGEEAIAMVWVMGPETMGVERERDCSGWGFFSAGGFLSEPSR